MRVGSLVFAVEQGLGYLAKSFFDAEVVTDVMVVRHGRRPELEDWYPDAERISNLAFCGNWQKMEDLCRRVDVMLFFETPFRWELIDYCRSIGKKTVLMPMYECEPKVLPAQPDLFLCPSLLDLSYYPGESIYEGNSVPGNPFVHLMKVMSTRSIYLPVPVEYPWRQRTQAEVFVHNAGHGGLKGRNGTQQFLEAICHVKSDARFVLRVQDGEFAVEKRLLDRVKDRLMIEGTLTYDRLFANGDVFVFPEKFNGLSLPLQEARASGMLVMSTDRFPMSVWLPREIDCSVCHRRNKTLFFLDPGPCPVCGGQYHSVGKVNPLIPVRAVKKSCINPRLNDFDEAVVEPIDLARHIDSWYGRDITEVSLSGKLWAETMSWKVLGPQYKKLLEDLCNE